MDYLDSKILSTINEKVKLISGNIGNSNVLIHSDIKNFFFEFNSRTDLLEKHLLNINEIFGSKWCESDIFIKGNPDYIFSSFTHALQPIIEVDKTRFR